MTTVCKTVGELKEALKKFDDNLPLKSFGIDSGGYDSIISNHVELEKVRMEGEQSSLFVSGEDQSNSWLR